MGGAILERQVYLIIAHNQKDLLLKLVKSLDYEFNDIIVHIDKKVKNWDFSEIKKAVKNQILRFTMKYRFSGGPSNTGNDVSTRKSKYSQIKC